MSWALSCLSLREHYDEVELYTDSAGYHILIEVLQLPYTKTHVIFDDFQCLPHHWALSKIKTYSLQTEPFLHIDGDIYLPKALPKETSISSIIVQNKEIGTSYYKNMMERILSTEGIQLPTSIAKKLRNNSIPSYNMGFFGGTDLSFIKRYTAEAEAFIIYNDMNNSRTKKSWVDCNILFEQILLATLVEQENKSVFCIHNKPTKDEGYTFDEFCNIRNYDKNDFFHILGGHKQNSLIKELLEKKIINSYPAFYLKIISLFPQKHNRLQLHPHKKQSFLFAEKCIAQFEDFLQNTEKEWKELDFKNLFFIERRILRGQTQFETIDKNEVRLCLNPHFKIYTIPSNWNKVAINILKQRYHHHYEKFEIAVIPALSNTGINDFAIGDLAINIIEALKNKKYTFSELTKEIYSCFYHKDEYRIKQLIKMEIEYLLYFGIVMI